MFDSFGGTAWVVEAVVVRVRLVVAAAGRTRKGLMAVAFIVVLVSGREAAKVLSGV